MKRLKTYLDSCVLIAAATGTNEVHERAMEILGDSNRDFLASVFTRLELIPYTARGNKQAEKEFYETYFASANLNVGLIDDVINRAELESCSIDLAALDSLHVAAAICAGADELITAEKPSKPIHKVTAIKICTIA